MSRARNPSSPTRENLLEHNGPRFHACPVQIRLDKHLFNEWMNNQMGGLGPPPSSPHSCLNANLPSPVSVSGEFSEMEGSRIWPWKVIDFGRGVGGGEGEFQEGGMAWPWAGRREGKCDWTRLTPERVCIRASQGSGCQGDGDTAKWQAPIYVHLLVLNFSFYMLFNKNST